MVVLRFAFRELTGDVCRLAKTAAAGLLLRYLGLDYMGWKEVELRVRAGGELL
jgi:hypothetical protein